MPTSLSAFIADNELAPFVLSQMQTDGFLTSLAMTPHLQDTTRWFPCLWGKENQPPFSSPEQLEQYAKIVVARWNELREALLTNQWCWPSQCTISDEGIINKATRDHCKGMLQGWALLTKDWADAIPQECAENALVSGVLLSISLLVDPSAALSHINKELPSTQEDELTPFDEIFEAMPLMLCGLTRRALELSEQK